MSTVRDPRSTNRAMISVIEKARGRREPHGTSRLLATALMGVFFLALMGALGIGASMYRYAVEAQGLATNLHLQAGLISNLVRSNDATGAIGIGDGPEGDALVLTRRLESGTFETRIYLYEGHIMQETAVAGRPYDPQGATPIVESHSFRFQLEGGMLRFETDEGSFVVTLRSDQPGGVA